MRKLITSWRDYYCQLNNTSLRITIRYPITYLDSSNLSSFIFQNFESPPPSYNHVAGENPVDDNRQADAKPKPTPRGKLSPSDHKPQNNEMFPELPNVPDELPNLPPGTSPNPSSSIDDIDFDDLSRRFENLKKSKWPSGAATIYYLIIILRNYRILFYFYYNTYF